MKRQSIGAITYSNIPKMKKAAKPKKSTLARILTIASFPGSAGV
jgi:hypothetical protein